MLNSEMGIPLHIERVTLHKWDFQVDVAPTVSILLICDEIVEEYQDDSPSNFFKRDT